MPRKANLKDKGTSPDLARLLDLLAGFPRQTIAVLGDFVLDRFVYGEISRVSREAPVLILRHRSTQSVPGGGANALNNLADLGARALPVGAVGDDAAGAALVEYFRKKKTDTSGIVTVRGWTTPTKTRYLAGWPHTTAQQVLRVDDEPREPLPDAVRKSLAAKLAQRARRAGALLVSDYGFGSAAPALARAVHPRRPTTLDSRYALLSYRGTGVTAATPNEAELENALHARIATGEGTVDALGQSALAQLRVAALLVTRGKDGMVLFEKNQAPRAIPIHGSDEAADVTGAGDTVVAVFTLALAAGATFFEAAHLANYAGGIVVMKRGTATVTRAELEAAIRSDATGGTAPQR